MSAFQTLLVLTTLVVVSVPNAHSLPTTPQYSLILKRGDTFDASARNKRSLEHQVQPSDSLIRARSHPTVKRSISEPKLKTSMNHHLGPNRTLSKRSARPVAPYRGHYFQRNAQLRRRPIKNRSRFYTTQAHLIRAQTSTTNQGTGTVPR